MHVFLASGAVRLVYYLIREIGHRNTEKFILISQINEFRCTIDQLSLLLVKFRQLLCSVRYLASNEWIAPNNSTETENTAERATKPLVKLQHGTECCHTTLRESTNYDF